MLAGCTNKGKVAMWKFNASSQEQWSLQPPVVLEGETELTQIQVYFNQAWCKTCCCLPCIIQIEYKSVPSKCSFTNVVCRYKECPCCK